MASMTLQDRFNMMVSRDRLDQEFQMELARLRSRPYTQSEPVEEDKEGMFVSENAILNPSSISLE